MLRNKALIFANAFYLIAFVFDAGITTIGMSSWGGKEGNPVVVWLWSIFGQDSFLLKVIYVLFIFSVSYYFYKKLSKFIGLIIPFSLGAGHVLGFSTWVFRQNNEFNSQLVWQFHAFLVPFGIFILSPVIGAILTLLVNKLSK